MAFQVGNREKLAGLAIVGLVTIGLLHYFLFMGKANTYRTALNRYMSERAKFSSTVVEGQRQQINDFIAANDTMYDFVYDLMKNLGVDWPDTFFPEEGEKAVEKRQKRFIELVDETAQLRTKHENIELPFLDWSQGEGWDVPVALPPSVASQILWDKIEQLRVTAMEIRVLDNPIALQNKRLVYNRQLAEIGLDSNRLLPEAPGVQTVANHGPLVPVIKKLAHARLIWDRKVKDEQAGSERIPITSKEELYQLLEIELPKDPDVLFVAIKQLEFLHRVIDIAEQENIEEIRAVKLMPMRKLDAAPDPDNPPNQMLVPEIIPQLAGTMGRMRGSSWVPPAAGRTGGSVYMPSDSDYSDYSDYSDGGPAPTPQATAVPGQPAPAPKEFDPFTQLVVPESIPRIGGEWVGDIVPLQIQTFATWENTLEFLYSLNHNQNPFEADSMQLQTNAGEGGRITTVVNLVPLANVSGLKAFFAPPTTATLTAASPAGTPPPLGGGAGQP